MSNLLPAFTAKPGLETEREKTGAPVSPAGAISLALDDTLHLLFQPFDVWRWLKLSLLCLFLGGGTPTAALQWSLSALPTDFRLRAVLGRGQQYIGLHPSLIILTILFVLALGLCFLYLRSLFRFALVDSLVMRRVTPVGAWSSLRLLGRSYFFWMVAALAGLGVAFSAMVLLAFAGLRGASPWGAGNLIATASLALILSLVVVIGIAAAILLMLTDDLAVPLMYAQHLPLPAAWRALWQQMREDSASFTVYLLVRFLLSVGVSVAVLLFLVPLLISLFSGAVIIAASVVLALHLAGLLWVWNLPTVSLAVAAVVLFVAIMLIVLSMVGMPGQVFLQSFGLRFIAARSPSLSRLFSLPPDTPQP